MTNETQENAANTAADDPVSRKFRLIISWVVVSILIGFGAAALIRLFTFSNPEDTFWETLFVEQFPVVVGIPMAALGALFITLILRVSTGPLEVEIGVLKFKGGAAPIVFWVVCFLSFVLSINTLWQS